MSQSEMNSVLIVDFMNHNWVKKDSEIITYNGVINFPRAGKKEDRHCVMCGKLEKKDKCIIPNQNKDVCRKCDSSYWLMKEFNVVIKFCKGCKTFFALMNYDEKPEASKCGTCRRRGRDNYHNKKIRQAEDNGNSIKRMRKSMSPEGFCNLVNTMTEEEDEVIDVQTLLEYASHDSDVRGMDCFIPIIEPGHHCCTTAEVEDLTKLKDFPEDDEMTDIFKWFSDMPISQADPYSDM